tara:strand:- start:694 stop:960 length:267 start_codon:yes stop_codon:yes gene_type:complete
MNQVDSPQHEIIGFKTSISDSLNKELVGLTGKIIFETKNMIHLETSTGYKLIPKNICKFLFDNIKEKTVVDGKKLIKRPYERLEMHYD